MVSKLQASRHHLLKGIGLLLFIIILYSQDWAKLGTVLRGLQWAWFLGFWFFYAVMICFRVERTRRASGNCGAPMQFAAAYRITVETSFWGSVTPGRLGELSKVGYLTPFGLSTRTAFALVVLERLYDVFALLVFGAASTFVAASYYPALLVMRQAVIVLLCCGGVFAFGAWWVRRDDRFRLAAWKVSRFVFRGGLTKNGISDFLLVNRNVRSVCAPVSGMWVVCNIITVYTIARALHIEASIFVISLTYILSSILAIIPISVAGLGTREATHILILAAAGVGKERSVLLSLSDGIIMPTIAIGLLMLPLLLTNRASGRPKGQTESA